MSVSMVALSLPIRYVYAFDGCRACQSFLDPDTRVPLNVPTLTIVRLDQGVSPLHIRGFSATFNLDLYADDRDETAALDAANRKCLSLRTCIRLANHTERYAANCQRSPVDKEAITGGVAHDNWFPWISAQAPTMEAWLIIMRALRFSVPVSLVALLAFPRLWTARYTSSIATRSSVATLQLSSTINIDLQVQPGKPSANESLEPVMGLDRTHCRGWVKGPRHSSRSRDPAYWGRSGQRCLLRL